MSTHGIYLYVCGCDICLCLGRLSTFCLGQATGFGTEGSLTSYTLMFTVNP